MATLLGVLGLAGLIATSSSSDATLAKQILSEAGVKGGLIVHLGCGSGRLTAALYRCAVGEDDSLLVHGLDTDPLQVRTARKYIRSLGIYGPVSADLWDGGQLPYVDNLVNLLVMSDEYDVPMKEVLRVLEPNGVALMPTTMNQAAQAAERGAPARHVDIGDRRWVRIVKPRPKEIDEWTHYLHDAGGNAVAHDSTVGPPRHVQWIGGPPHTRSHEHLPSIMALVSAGGRIFYIADRGPISSIRRAARWYLVARDAFNGILLWERSFRPWFPHIWNWGATPSQLQRRLVAVGNRVYVTLGLYAPLSVLDARTGKTLKVYEQTRGTDEIVYHKGILLLVIRGVTRERTDELAKWMRLEQMDESPLYSRETAQPLLKQFRSIDSKAPKSIVAIDAKSGRLLWRRTEAEVTRLKSVTLCADGDSVFYQNGDEVICLDLRTGWRIWSTRSLPLRLVSNGYVICVGGERIMALSAKTGELLWTQPSLLCQIRDAFIINGSLWLGGFKPYQGRKKGKRGPAWGPYYVTQRDLSTGKVLRHIEPKNPGHHHRCWRNKATDRYILSGRRGVEFVDLRTGEVLWHNWVRGVCKYGIMPCNGLLYAPPHACACYITAKLHGFYALAPARREGAADATDARLKRGPAYGAIEGPKSKAESSTDWSTYRHDAGRSGYTPSPVPAKLRRRWRTTVGGKLTGLTVAEGKVFVASVDEHRVFAIDADSGQQVWSFTAGARVDSPPTIYEGQALFGCRDGHVYCLRASDGVLAWRLRAARAEGRIVAYGQLESPWPVYGSVLIQDGAAYLTAGRSSYLDGGIDLYRIQPKTGEVLSKRTIYSPDPKTGKQPEQYGPSAMPGALADILTADERYIYLRDMVFDKSWAEQPQGNLHLLTLTGFLDDSWAHRSYWIFGTRCSVATGCSSRPRNLIYGRLIVFDGSSVYGYGRASVHWSNQLQDGPYRLFALNLADRTMRWAKRVPIYVRAMVLADKVLFAGGPPIGRTSRSGEGKGGQTALLIAFSALDGAELARYQLDSPPVFDGMAAADGRLYLACENGQVVCMGR
jgi:outer membrane protein assembly factor BamB/SAM-dependent methyltransferase